MDRHVPEFVSDGPHQSCETLKLLATADVRVLCLRSTADLRLCIKLVKAFNEDRTEVSPKSRTAQNRAEFASEPCNSACAPASPKYVDT